MLRHCQLGTQLIWPVEPSTQEPETASLKINGTQANLSQGSQNYATAELANIHRVSF